MQYKVEGKFVNLKKIEKDDIEIIRGWRNSTSVSKFMINKTFISEVDQISWFNKIQKDNKNIYWLIETKKYEKIGVVSLNKIDFSKKIANPGLYIGDIINRNSLFGLEAYYLALDFGFKKFKILNYIGNVNFENLPAIKMNKQFGFVETTRNEYDIEDLNLKDFFIKYELNLSNFENSKILKLFK